MGFTSSGALSGLRCQTCNNMTVKYDKDLRMYDTYKCDHVKGSVTTCQTGEVSFR